ncbi:MULTISPECIES: SurA N-terminal domain-containing protein [unclassified Streptomyces]|uniref:SurA N-terminal domain-containing protein n=1 Tax=Streptomyces TaxID=1883 RepID=UPI000FD788E6|nr:MULTISPECIES: SurA N-terminal domain-containing protein [unclassified Streptomyces]UQA34381.1 SurA N-terminal domain-containing protein [Streptomyces sp. HNA39]
MHRRRRTALAVSAAALLAAPLLAACGNEAHPGAAAVVGGERIEVSAVQAQAADVRAAQESSPEAAQLVNKSGQLNRAKLHGLIFGRILDKAAEDAGVTVTRKEIQEARTASRAQAGGEEQLRAMMLQQRWVAPEQIDNDMRQEVLLPKLAKALGADLGTPAGQQVVGEALTKASKALDIDVNPRFGAWDDQKMQLGNYQAPWISQVTEFAPQDPQAGA